MLVAVVRSPQRATSPSSGKPLPRHSCSFLKAWWTQNCPCWLRHWRPSEKWNSQRDEMPVLVGFLLWSSNSELGALDSWIGRGGEKSAVNRSSGELICDVTIRVYKSQFLCLPIDYSNRNRLFE